LIKLFKSYQLNNNFQVVERAHDFVEIRKQFLANLLELLVDVHSRSNESMRVLDVASLMMDPRYSLHKVFIIIYPYNLSIFNTFLVDYQGQTAKAAHPDLSERSCPSLKFDSNLLIYYVFFAFLQLL